MTCPSPALGGNLPAIVYLPAAYRGSTRRYPVIYFLHGLPADPQSYTGNTFVPAAVATGRDRAIVVTPQGSRSQGSDREYLDQEPTEDWPQAMSRDLTRCVDSRFRTIPDRFGRVLAGLSAGGYGAFNVGLRNLATFGAVESWSGYFEATDPSGRHVLDLGSAAANAGARAPRGAALKKSLARYPTFIGFFVGRQDSTFLSDNLAYDAGLRQQRIAHLFAVYPGGHSAALWKGQARRWLQYALNWLSRAQ